MNDVQGLSPLCSHPLTCGPHKALSSTTIPPHHGHGPSGPPAHPKGTFLHLTCDPNKDFNYLQGARIKCQAGITPAAASTRAAHKLPCAFRVCPCSSPDAGPWVTAERCQLVAVSSWPSLSMAASLFPQGLPTLAPLKGKWEFPDFIACAHRGTPKSPNSNTKVNDGCVAPASRKGRASAIFQHFHCITKLTCFPSFFLSNSNNYYPGLTFKAYFYFAQMLKAAGQTSGREINSTSSTEALGQCGTPHPSPGQLEGFQSRKEKSINSVFND